MTSLDAEVLIQQTSFNACFAPLNGLGKAWVRVALSILLPAVFALLFGLVKILSKYPATSKIVYKTMRSKKSIDVIAGLIFISQVIFLPLLNAIMTFFSCKTTVVDGKSIQLLKQFPDVQCFVSRPFAWKLLNSRIIIITSLIDFIDFRSFG